MRRWRVEAAAVRWRKRSIAGRPERNADHLLEYVAVAVPADPGAGIVAREERHGRNRLGSRPANAAALSRIGSSQSGIGSAGAKLASSKS